MKRNPLATLQAGLAQQNAGRLSEAEALYRAVLQVDPRSADALHLLGILEHQRGRHQEAADWITKAIRVLPKNAEFHNNLGLVQVALGRFAEAAPCFQQAARLRPDLHDAHFNLGVVLQNLGRVDEAVAAYEKALALRKEPGTLSNLGAAHFHQRRCEKAIACFQAALQIQPDHPEAFNNLGNVLLAARRPGEALLAYDHALRLKPDFVDAHYNRAHARLVLGDFEGGWSDYEYRWKWKGFPTQRPAFAQPEWNGEDLAGRTLLVYNEQGLGDTIQFSRYLSEAAARGGRVVVACPAELRELVQGIHGVAEVLAPGEPPPAFDVHAALLSLPRLCGTRLNNIPNQAPYLSAPAVERFPLPPRVDGRPRVGLVWAGGTRHPKDKLRSLALSHFASLLRANHCEFFSLQAGPASSELRTLPAELKIEDLGSRVRNFADTAAVMGQLDLVISADTATLHLAGALGRPVWGLLPYAPDWRWLLDREDSPWYSTLRLFRQPSPGDWPSVLASSRSRRRGASASFHDGGKIWKRRWRRLSSAATGRLVSQGPGHW